MKDKDWMTRDPPPAPDKCDHNFVAINQWQTICSKCGLDLESARP